MKLHRFYIGERHKRSTQDFGQQKMWTNDISLMHQWQKVLRFRVGEKISLFDDSAEFIYSITEFSNKEISLEKVTEEVRQLPGRQLLLAWSLIKKDNNDLVLQKGTELGVTHFVPLQSARCERTGFDLVRSTKIVIEAAEQCGRGDIPAIEEVLSPEECINRFHNHFKLNATNMDGDRYLLDQSKPNGVLVGPEGGWTETEIKLFKEHKISIIKISDHVLRAETAAIVAAYALQ